MQNLLNKKNLNEKKLVFFSSFIAILIWWLIFGFNLSNEPYIWDDLHFFRNYTSEEIKIHGL